jgi:hypothetical protein
LALWALPVHGVFVASEEYVSPVIDQVAKDHLGLVDARRELHEALAVIEEFRKRDAIETAVNHVRSVSDEAYFYAGLAFGLTLVEFS